MNGQIKKSILDNIYYNIGKQRYDFKVCALVKKGDKVIPTKWKKFSEAVFPIDFDGTCDNWSTQKFFEQINQREVLPNEVVLDLEDKKQLELVLKKLKKWEWEYHLYDTGSRGYHIHIFFKDSLSERHIKGVVRHFKADTQVTPGHMIALENYPHFKTGNIKKEIENGI